MVKPIKPPQPKGIPAVPLPFPPTQTPSHGHVAECAKTLLTLAQICFQGNPGPIITALKCAENTYIENAEQVGGMPVDDIEQFEVLGVALSKQLLKQAAEERKKAESGIITQDSRLVGPDGRPLVQETGPQEIEIPSNLFVDDPGPEEPAEVEEDTSTTNEE